jgi:hypothetical protein
VIGLLVLFVVVLIVLIVPYVATAVARNVVQSLDRSPASGSIDQSIVEARLGRIEEAIDAMALQIERLTDQQRALLGAPPGDSGDEDISRTERPR